VPLHASSMTALHDYAGLRDHLQPHPVDPSFFVSLTGKRLLHVLVSQTFRHLVDDAGVGAAAPHPLDTFNATISVVIGLQFYSLA
jgi:integrase/recombinase XerD